MALNYWDRPDLCPRSPIRRISVRLRINSPETYTYHSTTYSDSRLFVGRYGYSQIEIPVNRPRWSDWWSGVNGKHAISRPLQKNFNARKKFELGRLFEWLSICDLGALFGETLHLTNQFAWIMAFERSTSISIGLWALNFLWDPVKSRLHGTALLKNSISLNSPFRKLNFIEFPSQNCHRFNTIP
jgi:hypothetical protein